MTSLPPVPQNLVAARYDTTRNRITWYEPPFFDVGFDLVGIERSATGSSWDIAGSVVPNVLVFYDTVPNTIGYYYRVRSRGSAGWSDYITTASKTIVAPAAVTIGTAVRVSDTQATIGWTPHATSAAPYESQRVQRADETGNWVQIASLAGTASSYTDTTTSANHAYAYRVQAVNTAGWAMSDSSNWIYMTPAAASNVTAVKLSSTSVALTWQDNSYSESNFAIARTEDDGETWDEVAGVSAGVTSWTDTAAPEGTLKYRVLAYRGALYQAWSAASNAVTASAPPGAPTITSAWGPYSPTGATLRVSWQHNTLDASAQTAANIVYTKDGVETTYNLAGAGTDYDIPITGLAATKVATAKVQTKGMHASYGDHSATQSTTMADQPQVNITTPATDDTIVTDSPLVVAWSYTDEFALAGWTLRLLNAAGAVLKTWTGTTATSQTIGIADLPDDSGYSLTLETRSGSGFTATATRSFTTDYLGPTVPSVEATFDPDALSCTVSAAAGEEGELPATDHLALVRLETVDGVTETTVLADPLTPGSMLVDCVPRLGQSVTYRVLAVTATGAYSTTDVAVQTSGPHAINFGDGWAQCLRLDADPSLGDQVSNDNEQYGFASRALPVSFAGEHVTTTLALAATLLEESQKAAKKALDAWVQDCILRDPTGMRVSVQVTAASGDLKAMPRRVSFDLLVVE